ncbi:MAG: hypothetical protein GX228_05960 [Firmicutes bacterium]|nr:hypothetical protein [Bacillota bacterium]NLL88468.1 hypothetical protein [Bacillota bacterium]HKM18214.1 hypothetical protein [Limnochordia bacterium]
MRVKLVLLILCMLAAVGCKGPYYVEVDIWLKRQGPVVEIEAKPIDYQITREAALRRSELARRIEAVVAQVWEQFGEEEYQRILDAFDAEMAKYPSDSPLRNGIRSRKTSFGELGMRTG